MFKFATALAIVAAAALAPIGAPPASAQNRIGLIEITNKGGETRRVCFYKDKRINLKAEECFDVPAGRTAIYARGENRKAERMKIKTFTCCRLIPKLIEVQDRLPGDIVSITVWESGRFQFGRYLKPVPRKPEYRVKFCNTRQATPVWLAIAAGGGIQGSEKTITEGYWSIPRGECVTINYSERLMRAGAGYPPNPPLMMYRAYTTGEARMQWSGTAENEDPALCVNTAKKFIIDQVKDPAKGGLYACDGENEAKQRFRWAPTLDREVQVGRVDF